MKYIAYVGHQTDDKNEGIRILEADAETGQFRQRRLLHVPNAIYMAVNRAKTRLYTSFSDTTFGPRGKSGGLAAYAIKGDDLVKINALGTGASTPCHVSLAPDEKALVYAEYGGATAGFVELADDAALDDANIGRFVDALKEFLDRSQFLIITHNQHTIAGSDLVYGVSQQEKGVSRIISMRLADIGVKKQEG